MLVVVEHGLPQPRAQLFFDGEAMRRGEILQLYGAERLLDAHDDLDHTVRILLGHQDRHAGEINQRGKQRRLALHHGQSGQRPDIAEAKDRRAVGDDRDRPADVGVLVGAARVGAYGKADPGHARRVDVAQHLQRVDRQSRLHADLAATMAVEDTIGLAHEGGVGQRVDARVQVVIGLFVHFQRDFPERPALLAAHGRQMLDHETGLGDDLQNLGEAARLVDRFDHQDLGYLHEQAVSITSTGVRQRGGGGKYFRVQLGGRERGRRIAAGQGDHHRHPG